MRIHCSSAVTEAVIYKAARFAGVDIVTEGKLERGSRSADHAFEVKLEGDSRRAPNGGASGKGYASGKAATWDQWGVFLAVLFDFDPDAKCWAYENRADFHAKTFSRFEPGGIVGAGYSSNYNVVCVPAHVETVIYVNGERQVSTPADQVVQRIAGSYWPSDAHGDHRFEFAGDPGGQSCTKCSARFNRLAA